MLFINNTDSSRDLIVFMTSFISSFLTPDHIIFLGIAASVADAPAVNPNAVKTLLANGLSAFPIKGNPVFSKSLPKSPPDCPFLYN